MSQLSNLTAKPKTYKIGDQQLSLLPRTMKDIDLVMDLSEESKRADALKRLIISTLMDSVEGATEEEANKVAFQHFTELSKAILDVNGLKEGKEDASTD